MSDMEKVQCQNCPTEFVPVKSWQRFCSTACKVKWHSDQRSLAVRLMREYPQPVTVAST
jgi:hypothetical protein